MWSRLRHRVADLFGSQNGALPRGSSAHEWRDTPLAPGTREVRIETTAEALALAGSTQSGSVRPTDDTSSGFNIVDEALPAGAGGQHSFAAGTSSDLDSTDEFEVVPIEPVRDESANDRTLEVDRKKSWAATMFARVFRTGQTEADAVGAGKLDGAKPGAGFLFAKFRAFYHEVIRFQHQKSEFAAGFVTAVMSDGDDTGPDAAARALSHRLSELLALQAAEAKWMGGEAAERYPDAQYAMAALADEIFTYSAWEGQSAWPNYRLEQEIYKSRGAELAVFGRMDALLKESPDTAVGRDLARVYLLVLAAGFQGKWRPFGLSRAVAEYRRRLYEYIHRGDALLLYSTDRRVFPDAVSRTLEGHAVSRFSAAQRWAAILAVLVVTYLVVAHYAWTRASTDLRDVTTRIELVSPTATP